jgi:ureidoglycolate dehydrogenase (NAD+)
MNSFYRINPQPLSEICSLILQKNGVPIEDAKTVSDSLVDADLRGVSSHGVIRMSIYLNRLEKGVMAKQTAVVTMNETESTAVLDGGYGIGQVVSQRAIDLLLEKAKNANLAAISVRRSNHFGAAAYWASQLLEHNMIGFVVSNVEPLMPPPGGAAAKVGNNPIAMAIPAGDEKPIVVDMATSVVPLGKILAAKSKGQEIPLGWAVDRSGEPTTNPDDVVQGGFLFPVGGPKGYGLAVLVDILSAVLSNGAIGPDIHSMYQDFENPNDISHFFMALRVDAFMDPTLFKASVDRYIQYMKDTPLTAGAKEIYLPGEIEANNKEKNLIEGIVLPKSVAEELESFGRAAGIQASLIEELTNNPYEETVSNI